MTAAADEVSRLRSRLERERRARRQAEIIAERGMRELWEANRELQARVARRTAELERLVDGLEYAHAARLRAIVELADDVGGDLASPDGCLDVDRLRHATTGLDEIRLLAEPARPADDRSAIECRPTEIGDRLIERWQRPAARRGQLLTVEVGSSPELARFHWAQVMAIADVVVGGFVRHGASGGLSVVLTVHGGEVGLEVQGPADGRRDGPRELGAVGADLALADRMVASCEGSCEVRRHDDDTLVVSVSLPAGR